MNIDFKVGDRFILYGQKMTILSILENEALCTWLDEDSWESTKIPLTLIAENLKVQSNQIEQSELQEENTKVAFTLAPSENTYAIHISTDGKLSFHNQVIGYQFTKDGTILNYITHAVYGREYFKYGEVDIFATKNSFTVTSKNENSFAGCYHSIDDFIRMLEFQILEISISSQCTNWLMYPYTFILLSKITKIDFNVDYLRTSIKKIQNKAPVIDVISP